MDNSVYWIGGILVVLISSGAIVMQESGTRDLCKDGELWIEQDKEGLYYCESEDSYRWCDHLSSTDRTCYMMEVIFNIQHVNKCTTTFYNESENIWDFHDVWNEVNKTYDNTIYLKEVIIHELNSTDCERIGLIIGDKKIIFGDNYCDYTVTPNATIELECDSLKDGDKSGSCESGEDLCHKIIFSKNESPSKTFNTIDGFKEESIREIKEDTTLEVIK